MTEYLAVIFHFCLGTLFLLFGINLILRKGLIASKLLGIQFTVLAITLIISYYLTENNILDHPYFFRSLSPLLPTINFNFSCGVSCNSFKRIFIPPSLWEASIIILGKLLISWKRPNNPVF